MKHLTLRGAAIVIALAAATTFAQDSKTAQAAAKAESKKVQLAVRTSEKELKSAVAASERLVVRETDGTYWLFGAADVSQVQGTTITLKKGSSVTIGNSKAFDPN